MYYILEKVVEI